MSRSDKAVVLLGRGRAVAAAEPLLLDEDTVRNYWTRYREGGLEALGKDGYAGALGCLNETQRQALEVHLYIMVQGDGAYMQERFGVEYTGSGMTDSLHRLKFVYNKPKVGPGQVEAAGAPIPAQRDASLRLDQVVRERRHAKAEAIYVICDNAYTAPSLTMRRRQPQRTGSITREYALR